MFEGWTHVRLGFCKHPSFRSYKHKKDIGPFILQHAKEMPLPNKGTNKADEDIYQYVVSIIKKISHAYCPNFIYVDRAKIDNARSKSGYITDAV